MAFCPECGSQIAANAGFCGTCGHATRRAPQPDAGAAPAGAAPEAGAAGGGKAGGLSKATMVGFASPFASPGAMPPAAAPPVPSPEQAPAPAGQPQRAPERSVAKTMLGMAALPVPAAPPPEPPPGTGPAGGGAGGGAGKNAKTMMLGAYVPAGLPQAPPQPVDAPLTQPAGSPGNKKTLVGGPGLAPQPAAGGNKKTLMGMPGLGAGPAGQPQGAPSGVSKKTLVGFGSPFGGSKKTLLGLSVPGLQAPAEPEYVEEEYEEVVAETGEVQRRVRLVAKPPPPLHRRPAFYALLVAALLLVGGVVVAVAVKSSPPISTEARLDADGKDVLHVVCKSCPDGTALTGPGGAKATTQGGEADVKLAEPLKVGPNAIAIAVDRPENGRDETVNVQVPVAYRIAPDINALQDPTPAVRVVIEALPGSVVTVQGKPVALDANGQGSARVEVGEALAALPRDAKVLERDIPYTIATKGGSPESGKLQVRVGVAPLTLESPGLHLVTDQPTFLLAGRTAKGGGLSAAGTAIAVNQDGTFKQHMKISAPGSTEVVLRASAHGLAPRLVTLRLKLVQSLAAEAKDLEAQNRLGYGDVASKLEQSAGTPVAWKGEVVSSNPQANQTVAVIEVGTGCAKKPCRARVVVPNGPPLASGDKLSVYGRVAGVAATTSGEKLPDIEADFVTKGP